jgi:hypothetical protein
VPVETGEERAHHQAVHAARPRLPHHHTSDELDPVPVLFGKSLELFHREVR